MKINNEYEICIKNIIDILSNEEDIITCFNDIELTVKNFRNRIDNNFIKLVDYYEL